MADISIYYLSVFKLAKVTILFIVELKNEVSRANANSNKKRLNVSHFCIGTILPQLEERAGWQ